MNFKMENIMGKITLPNHIVLPAGVSVSFAYSPEIFAAKADKASTEARLDKVNEVASMILDSLAGLENNLCLTHHMEFKMQGAVHNSSFVNCMPLAAAAAPMREAPLPALPLILPEELRTLECRITGKGAETVLDRTRAAIRLSLIQQLYRDYLLEDPNSVATKVEQNKVLLEELNQRLADLALKNEQKQSKDKVNLDAFAMYS
jgi:hypothetical protein